MRTPGGPIPLVRRPGSGEVVPGARRGETALDQANRVQDHFRRSVDDPLNAESVPVVLAGHGPLIPRS
jgi:hypothetical protein